MAQSGVHIFSNELTSFSVTAAIIQNLDLIIAVDTSVAHLAAALGKPTWILLAAKPDWRWLLERRDSPWYPSVRLFRQRTLARWDDIVQDVICGLRQLRAGQDEKMLHT